MKHSIILSIIFYAVTSVYADSLSVITKEFYKCTEDTSVYVKISYPQISNMKDQQVQNKINLMLEDQFLFAVQSYEEFASDPELLADYPADWGFVFEVTYRITYQSRNVISIVMDHYEFTGGAHGNYFSEGYNIRLSDGKLLLLTDVIKENKLENLSLLCEQEIMELFEVESLSDVLFEDEINLTNEQDFYFEPYYLILQFDPYEIGPYAMGSIEVKLSFDKLKDLLQNNFLP